jgi:hypothetical protein
MTRVYILTAGSFHDFIVISVHATPEGAQAALESMVDDDYLGPMAGTGRWSVWEVQP